MRKALAIIVLVCIIVFVMWSSKNFGMFGFCLSLCAVVSMVIRSGANMNLYNLPASVKKITAWVIGITVSIIAIMWLWKTIPKIKGVESFTSQKGSDSIERMTPVYVYDFKGEKALKTLTVKYYFGSVVSVILPAGASVRKDSESDVQIYYPMDGLSVIVGPGKEIHTPGGLKRTVFRVRGLERSGTMTIYLEKS